MRQSHCSVPQAAATAVGDGGQQLAGGGVDDIDSAAVDGVLPLAVDE